jgi:hypothetical protein
LDTVTHEQDGDDPDNTLFFDDYGSAAVKLFSRLRGFSLLVNMVVREAAH